MAYCRFFEGDVYMYADREDGITCCMCDLTGKDYTRFDTAAEALTHLSEHVKAGHIVPERAARRIREDDAKGLFGRPRGGRHKRMVILFKAKLRKR